MLPLLIIIFIVSCAVATSVVIFPYVAYMLIELYSFAERNSKDMNIKLPEIKMSIFRSRCILPQNEEPSCDNILNV